MNKHIKTSTGFECDVNSDVLDDLEFFELCVAADDPQEGIKKTPVIIEALLGKEQKANLYEHLRRRIGYVSLSVMKSEIQEIILGLGDDKKK